MPKTPYDYEDLFDGTQSSTCPLPCTTHLIESRLLSKENTGMEYSMISITFSQSTLVTKTNFLRFSFSNLLSSLGGSMGLWLGLGLLQTLELGLEFLVRRSREIRQYFEYEN